MKKTLSAIIVLCMLLAFSGCNTAKGAKEDVDSAVSKVESIVSDVESDMDDGDTTESDSADLKDGNLRDGIYKEESKTYSEDGYKSIVAVKIEDGEIADVECDAISKSGKYRREQKSQKDWKEKIEKFENEIEEKGIDGVKVNEDGSVSDITGMDLSVGEYYELIKKAVEQAK